MKTTLEWVMWKDSKPTTERSMGRSVLVEECISWSTPEECRVVFMLNSKQIYILNMMESTGKTFVKWAYINLPEEEEKDNVNVKCWECQESKPLDAMVPIKSLEPPVLICKECKEMEEKKNEETWIGLLKQLPEKGQLVKIIVNHPTNVNSEYEAIYHELGFFDPNEKRFLPLNRYENVIAWRPLREKKQKEPEDRKPDFSKLREGDLVLINDRQIGFLDEINFKNLHFILRSRKEDTPNCYISSISFEIIKKIIRINIDEPTDIVGKIFHGGVIWSNEKTYPFEEI